MINKNEQTTGDDLIKLLKGKKLELSNLTRSLDYQMQNVINQMQKPQDDDDIETYFNNLQLMASMHIFYTNQVKILEEKIFKYYAINSSENKIKKLNFMNFWIDEVKIFLEHSSNFNFSYTDVINQDNLDPNDRSYNNSLFIKIKKKSQNK